MSYISFMIFNNMSKGRSPMDSRGCFPIIIVLGLISLITIAMVKSKSKQSTPVKIHQNTLKTSNNHETSTYYWWRNI